MTHKSFLYEQIIIKKQNILFADTDTDSFKIREGKRVRRKVIFIYIINIYKYKIKNYFFLLSKYNTTKK